MFENSDHDNYYVADKYCMLHELVYMFTIHHVLAFIFTTVALTSVHFHLYTTMILEPIKKGSSCAEVLRLIFMVSLHENNKSRWDHDT